MRNAFLYGLILSLGCFGIPALAEDVPDFSGDIQPILEEHCVSCHGPKKQKGGLRLDLAAALSQGGDSEDFLVAGDSEASLLYKVVAGLHEDITMPPKGEGLNTEELAQLKAWIDAGALLPEDTGERAKVVSDHWAYQPIARPEVPEVQYKDWLFNPIDAFVLHGLEAEGHAPGAAADKVTLMRRLYLDLIGLPPTPEEVEAYVNDSSPTAYYDLVERLLASEHYGERWGRHWLDIARYADSDGYEKDTFRPWAWRYRNWVIDALNRDLPYDQFIIEQLAGDLLPDATLEQQVATGFHRNTLTNREGGVDQEEFRIAQVLDRTDTTYQALMGITMNCAQCHSHKYDPISIREYYESMAFFNVGMEKDIAAPLPVDIANFDKKKEKSDRWIARARSAIQDYAPELKDKLATWEASLEVPEEGWEPLSPSSSASAGGSEFKELKDKSLLVKGPIPETDTYTIVARTRSKGIQAIRLEVLADKFLGSKGPGRAENGNFVLTSFSLQVAPYNKPHEAKTVKFNKVEDSHHQDKYPAEDILDEDPKSGWAIQGGVGKDQYVTLWLEEPIDFNDGALLNFTMDQRYGRQHNIGRFRFSTISIDPDAVPGDDFLHQALLKDADERSDEETERVLAHFATQDPKMKRLQYKLDRLLAAAPKKPNTMAQAIVANPDPPNTYIHLRGDFLSKGDQVQANTPALFPELEARGDTPDRLDFARWLMEEENPLTSRVAVNRVWDKLFGKGLVRTPEDFGVRGEAPTHPELLDWLARHFMEQGWGQKDLIRTIVQSNTYQQASTYRPELMEEDPENRLLARQNRFRVEAEITRDMFLATGNLLNPTIGGPSVRPPLPKGFANLGYSNSVKYDQSKGDAIYRRGLYIQFQRTIAFPMLMTFDCPDSNTTNIKRSRSNTPLQALTLLNDPVFVQCAAGLGSRILTEIEGGVEERIKHAFQICMARTPRPDEVAMLVALVEEQQTYYEDNPEDAETLLSDFAPEGVEAAEAAAYMNLARCILNLDEFLTRE